MVIIRWLALHLAAHTGRDVSDVCQASREVRTVGV